MEDKLEIVLISAHANSQSTLPFDLVKKCLDIQMKHLYEKDRGTSSQLIKKLVEAYVEESREN